MEWNVGCIHIFNLPQAGICDWIGQHKKKRILANFMVMGFKVSILDFLWTEKLKPFEVCIWDQRKRSKWYILCPWVKRLITCIISKLLNLNDCLKMFRLVWWYAEILCKRAKILFSSRINSWLEEEEKYATPIYYSKLLVLFKGWPVTGYEILFQ